VSIASASVLTGNILVTFDPARDLSEIVIIVTAALRSANENDGQLRTTAASHRPAHQPEVAPVAPPPADRHTPPWHALDADDVLARLETSPRDGLSAAQVEASEARHGRNLTPRATPRSSLDILKSQFDSFPVLLLVGSAALSVVTGGLADAAAILGIVALNAAIGYASESRSEQTIHAFSQLAEPRATVIRDATRLSIETEAIVPGDIVVLTRGNMVPADARVIDARDLFLDESALTGESAPVSKDTHGLHGGNVPLSERINMVYKGTSVVGGSGLAVVVGTGRNTEVGRIQALVEGERPPETPLQRQLDHLGVRLTFASLAAAGTVFALGILRGIGGLAMLRSALSLALAALPEGFPAISTATLALSIRNMRQHKVVARRLDAIETLGTVGVICLDKTGTLTANRMSVVLVRAGSINHEFVHGRFPKESPGDPRDRGDMIRTLEIGALCNEAEAGIPNTPASFNGSPTENALVRVAISAGIDVSELRRRHPRIDTLYRSEARRFMATLHDSGGDFVLAVKGNPMDVLQRCAFIRERGVVRPLDDADRARIAAENEKLAVRALRVLGIASRDASHGISDRDLVWLGMVGMSDPIRPGMRELMRVFRQAQIQTVVITGDQTATAVAVARELALANGDPIQVLDEQDLEQRPPEEIAELVQRVHVFSRVTPGDKLQIVRAFQRAGKIVAMTGDGINDSPALRAADIGIAIEGGTEAARQAADIVIEDDDLYALVAAIHQGRTVHRNIRKALRFLLATNASEVIYMLGTIAAGSPPPLSPAQLLWINLLTDSLPAVSLGLEPSAPDAMHVPPADPDAPILGQRDVPTLLGQAGFISAGAFGTLLYGLGRYGVGPRARGLAFNALVAGQLFHAFSARSETRSVFNRDRMPPNPYLRWAIAATAAMQGGAWLLPATRRMLGFPPLGILDTLVLGAAAVLPFMANEALKGRPRGGIPHATPGDDLPVNEPTPSSLR
jgi:Ca2+-transporting ATPase